jgi:simple sugar transport system substrate-binding protein
MTKYRTPRHTAASQQPDSVAAVPAVPASQPLAARARSRRGLIALPVAGAGAAALAAPARLLAQSAPQPLRIGFVYVSPIGEAGWTTQHNRGRLQMEQALGAAVRTTFVESVAEGADAERVIRDLAAQGHRLIFTTSFGYMEPTLRVARQFPNVIFEHATGYKSAPNMGHYNARFYEGRYLAGIVAGRTTRSNLAGYVAAFPIPEVLQGINAFTLGMRSVNPKAELKVVWTSAWYDPPKERDAAATLLAQGADVLTHHTDSTATVQVAEEKGKWSIGYHSDMSKFGPKGHLTAVSHHWGDYYTRVARSVIEGKWKPSGVWGGIREGFIRLEPFNASVPADVRQQVAARQADIAAGRFHPFSGRIVDADGKLRHEGGPMADDALNRIDWTVQGVQGRPPKG